MIRPGRNGKAKFLDKLRRKRYLPENKEKQNDSLSPASNGLFNSSELAA